MMNFNICKKRSPLKGHFFPATEIKPIFFCVCLNRKFLLGISKTQTLLSVTNILNRNVRVQINYSSPLPPISTNTNTNTNASA